MCIIFFFFGIWISTCSIMVLQYVSLKTNEVNKVEHLFICLFAIWVIFLLKLLFKSFAYFLRLLFSHCWVLRVCYILLLFNLYFFMISIPNVRLELMTPKIKCHMLLQLRQPGTMKVCYILDRNPLLHVSVRLELVFFSSVF